MNSKEKREEIVALINNIKDHSDRLKHMPHMPLLEVSAIMSKINKLHENTVVLKYLLATEQHHEDEEFGIELTERKKKNQEKSKATSSAKENKEYSRESSSEIDLEEDPDDIDDYDDDYEQDDDLDVDHAEIDLQDEMNREAESTEGEMGTEAIAEATIEEMEKKSGVSSQSDINEQYAEEQEDRSLSEQLKKQPIADLLTAIGLNERYLYANDLFGGDIEEFRKVVRILNEFDTEEEATTYFNDELRRTYGWDDDNELANALFLLVKRRFQSSEE